MAYLIMAEGVTPSTPSTGKVTVFINTNGILCWIDDTGAVYAAAPSQQSVTFTGATTINRLIVGAGADLTIAGGVLTVTHTMHRIDTEGGAATDDLDTINGAVAAGQLLTISTVTGARDPTIKNLTGNIQLNGGVDFTLSTARHRVTLIWLGTIWTEIARCV